MVDEIFSARRRRGVCQEPVGQKGAEPLNPMLAGGLACGGVAWSLNGSGAVLNRLAAFSHAKTSRNGFVYFAGCSGVFSSSNRSPCSRAAHTRLSVSAVLPRLIRNWTVNSFRLLGEAGTILKSFLLAFEPK